MEQLWSIKPQGKRTMGKCASTVVALVLVVTLMQLPLRASELAWPPPRMDRHEQALTSDQVAKSPCTELARGIAGKLPGIVMDSETASLSDAYGHVYRYDLVDVIEHGGKTYQVRTILVVHSRECQALMLATHPTFELPSSSSRP